MNRIAVCISGQPRSFQKGYQFVKKNLIDNNDCDVFIHTWENDVYDCKDVIDLYKPVSYKIEKFPEGEFDKKYTNTPNPSVFPARNSVMAYYSIFQSMLLKIDNELKTKQYDWVVKTRFDYAVNGRLPFDQLDKNKLYIPNCRVVPTRDFGNDQFAFGSSSVMNDYMSTYINLDTFYNMGVQMNGEEMMRANLHKHNLIGDRLMYVDMNNPFPAGPYNGTPHSLIRDDMELWK